MNVRQGRQTLEHPNLYFQRGNLIVDQIRNREFHDSAVLRDRQDLVGPQQPRRFDRLGIRQHQPHLLVSHRIGGPPRSRFEVRIGIVDQMDGIAGLGDPTEGFDQSISTHLQRPLVVHQPADRIRDQVPQIGGTGAGVGGLDIAGQIDQPRRSIFAEYREGFIGVRVGTEYSPPADKTDRPPHLSYRAVHRGGSEPGNWGLGSSWCP